MTVRGHFRSNSSGAGRPTGGRISPTRSWICSLCSASRRGMSLLQAGFQPIEQMPHRPAERQGHVDGVMVRQAVGAPVSASCPAGFLFASFHQAGQGFPGRRHPLPPERMSAGSSPEKRMISRTGMRRLFEPLSCRCPSQTACRQPTYNQALRAPISGIRRLKYPGMATTLSGKTISSYRSLWTTSTWASSSCGSVLTCSSIIFTIIIGSEQ